ncbi:hypothetical protein M378DRAFT_13704 [Amanita muscaria Koide BX008]|uniref:Uncharacterized protein n=1 Tax=Amanita muscaria (strain Koide BX008) TaxID=946122 RepID=A0A0C2WWG5_AMAMK|nr:hypothetical protein M378DRAFT_13704 [Amanita muscaria Koide BX008]
MLSSKLVKTTPRYHLSLYCFSPLIFGVISTLNVLRVSAPFGGILTLIGNVLGVIKRDIFIRKSSSSSFSVWTNYLASKVYGAPLLKPLFHLPGLTRAFRSPPQRVPTFRHSSRFMQQRMRLPNNVSPCCRLSEDVLPDHIDGPFYVGKPVGRFLCSSASGSRLDFILIY